MACRLLQKYVQRPLLPYYYIDRKNDVGEFKTGKVNAMGSIGACAVKFANTVLSLKEHLQARH